MSETAGDDGSVGDEVKKSKDGIEQDNQATEAGQVVDETEQLDLGDVNSLDGAGRNVLYEKGKVYQQKGNKKLALQCFLGCIKGIKQNSGFLYLPQCLRAIADTYYEMEEYTHAVQFIQAEKMYYETALVDIVELQRKIADSKTEEDTQMGSKGKGDSGTPEALKAIEYENLARLCLDKEQPLLALEYSAKATKLRQQVYGDNHAITQSSLDLFTTMYAEVGKHQYMETLRKIGDKAYSVPDNQNETVPDTNSQQSDTSNTGLRQRRAPAGDSSQQESANQRRVETTQSQEELMNQRQRLQRDAEPYPWQFYMWLSPFIVIFAIACSILFYDIYLIFTEA